jgi:hypothetical protein
MITVNKMTLSSEIKNIEVNLGCGDVLLVPVYEYYDLNKDILALSNNPNIDVNVFVDEDSKLCGMYTTE